jgi:uncharacterized protein YutE (UPF0331/DUF86 family)
MRQRDDQRWKDEALLRAMEKHLKQALAALEEFDSTLLKQPDELTVYRLGFAQLEYQKVLESSTIVTAATTNRYASVPWERLRRLRQRWVHGYFSVSHREVFQEISEQGPSLQKTVRATLKAFRAEGLVPPGPNRE